MYWLIWHGAQARVFVNSSLYHKGVNGTILSDWKWQISRVQVPLVLLGDPAYSALPWLNRRTNHQLANVPNVVVACAVLHNMCKMFGDNCRE